MVLGSECGSITMSSGIRQGCPASGSIFVLALDPWMRMLLLRIPRALPCGFADDVAILLQELVADFAALIVVLNTLTKAAGLHINYNKTYIVPLRPGADKDQWRRLIGFIAPDWRRVNICDCAKFLGVFIGNNFDDFLWQAPSTKFFLRVASVAALAGSWSSQIHSYRLVLYPHCPM